MEEPLPNQIIIITAPSGSGKTTIIRALLEKFPSLQFSISATTRAPRKNEKDGKDYHFLSPEAFKQKIEEDAFAEYEMVYHNKYYGTLKAKLAEIWQTRQVPLIDIDIQGAQKIKKQYGEQAMSIFIQVPSLEELATRLKSRGTESEEMIQERVDKAAKELQEKKKFDYIVVNDELDKAIAECEKLILTFTNNQ